MTAGEGIQNLLCAGQALAALIAVLAAAAGVAVIDPLAAVLIAGIAAKVRHLRLNGDRPCVQVRQRLRRQRGNGLVVSAR